MKFTTLNGLVLLAAALAGSAEAQIYDTNNVIVQTFAGSGFYGYVDGIGEQTMFNNPIGITADNVGNLFVLDASNKLIRKITPAAVVSSFAGNGYIITGNAMAAIALQPPYSLFVADSFASSFTGVTSDDGQSWQAIYTPYPSGVTYSYGVCVDSQSSIYFSDSGGNKIYRYRTNGVQEVFVGSGNNGHANGNGIFTSFNYPKALAADSANNIYVWDSSNYLIRKINQNRDVTTFAGIYNQQSSVDGGPLTASFNDVGGMCIDAFGNLIVASRYAVRKVSPSGNVTTIAGSFTESGYTNGPGSVARFANAAAVCCFRTNIFVCDSYDNRIRIITQAVTQPPLPAELSMEMYPGVKVSGIVGRSYQIQASADLATWSTAASIVLTSSPYLWIDQNPVSGRKFYRAVLLP
jgi:sugar lactone lactonase YvrE